MKIILISEDGSRHTKLSFNPWFIITAITALTLLINSAVQMQNNQGDAYYYGIDTNGMANASKQPLARGGLAQNENPNSFYRPTYKYNKTDDQAHSHLPLAKQVKILEASIDDSMRTLPHKERLSGDFLESVSLNRSPIKKGFISSRYGYRSDPFNGRTARHRGVDVAAKLGEKVYSPASGFVVFTGRKGGYGKVVEIQHDKNLLTRYAHLNKILVRQNDVVKQGEVIARVGRTGRATGPHLHLEVLKNGRHVDPQLYFDGSIVGQ